MKQTFPYTEREIEALLMHFDTLIEDVSSLARQLKKAEKLNKILVSKNSRLCDTLESVLPQHRTHPNEITVH